jgi:hypothetical protein
MMLQYELSIFYDVKIPPRKILNLGFPRDIKVKKKKILKTPDFRKTAFVKQTLL